ncbi:MAG: hypothetical protein GY853_09740 [PVC group bacterium]|nr:hypothetical protein [PVC group bacterium]
MSIIVISDLHIKNKEPYLSATIKFFDWLLENYKDEIIIQLGDLFDESSPHNDLRNMANKYLTQFKKVYTIAGNHDYSKIKGLATLQFSEFNNVFVYDKPTIIEIENMKCLMLPYLYTNMKEQYEQLRGRYDYVFTHITPPECEFGDEGIQLNMDSVYIHGHTHTQLDFLDNRKQQHYVLGVPTTTRHLEHEQVHRIAEIKDDKVSFIEVPQYFTFRTVEYGDEIKEEWKNDIINVKNAPSMNSVHDKYKGFNIRDSGISLKEFNEDSDDAVFEFSEDALQKYFSEFSKEEDLPRNKHNTIAGYFDKN